MRHANDGPVALTKYRGITVIEDGSMDPSQAVIVCMPVTGLVSCIVVGPDCTRALTESMDVGRMPAGWKIVNAVRDVSREFDLVLENDHGHVAG